MQEGITFVVEDDHAIKYAGQRFSEATKAVRGSNSVHAWLNDQWIGDLNYKGEWTYKTGAHPDR